MGIGLSLCIAAYIALHLEKTPITNRLRFIDTNKEVRLYVKYVCPVHDRICQCVYVIYQRAYVIYLIYVITYLRICYLYVN